MQDYKSVRAAAMAGPAIMVICLLMVLLSSCAGIVNRDENYGVWPSRYAVSPLTLNEYSYQTIQNVIDRELYDTTWTYVRMPDDYPRPFKLTNTMPNGVEVTIWPDTSGIFVEEMYFKGPNVVQQRYLLSRMPTTCKCLVGPAEVNCMFDLPRRRFD